MDSKDIINKKPLGSIERLYLIYKYGNTRQSSAANRCIKKRLQRIELKQTENERMENKRKGLSFSL